ncbi:MAG: ABC transporter substrate-binding protein [Deltaproteobacteria bacterium]|nr:ABC transporter substrate-binding protein [Deltaproteobacteria bacterium]
MKLTKKMMAVMIVLCFFGFILSSCGEGVTVVDKVKKAVGIGGGKAEFDHKNYSDMSDFDPDNPVIPTGDTIKIAIVASFSGPAAIVGDIYWMPVQWAAHDINKRGGILVDGKKKLVQVIKADHQSQVPVCKKVAERMVLKEGVHVLWGTNGSHLMKVINQVAAKYKVIAQCTAALSDELYDAQNFTRYSFMSSFSCEQIGRSFAYFYGKKRKKEKKFYILCQDYMFGHSLAAGFKKGLKEYYPDAEIVGEDYHKLFLTDFAPYLEKIKASGAEVIYTGDWVPDAANLLIQARQAGITLPFANVFMNEPNFLHKVGVEGTTGLMNIDQFASKPPAFQTEEYKNFYLSWHNLYKNKWQGKWKNYLWAHGTSTMGSYRQQTYWLLSVIERAGTLDPEKIIEVWEGDTYTMANGHEITMRACDHKAVQDLYISEFGPPELQKKTYNIEPYYWYQGCSSAVDVTEIPANKILPAMDTKLERCQ